MNPLPARVATVDYHTGGEPFRIVADVPIPLPGDDVAQRRALAMMDAAAQGLRSLLCSEPRGHADMYGGFVVPPDDNGAHLGALFWHKDGFSTACGHGTIALGAWAVNSGVVAAPVDGEVDVRIDVPSGRVTARVHRRGGRVVAVDFINVASWAVATEVVVPTSRGDVLVDVAFGGAMYASLPASAVGLAVSPGQLGALIDLGREIQRHLNRTPHCRHPADPRLDGIYGTVWFEELGSSPEEIHQRNVTIFADGEVDRSPCGSGTSARMALLAASGALSEKVLLRHESIVGSTFIGRILGSLDVGGIPAILPQVTGMAYPTGEHVFLVDPEDPLVPGFVLR